MSKEYPPLLPQTDLTTVIQRINCTDTPRHRLRSVGMGHLEKTGPERSQKGRGRAPSSSTPNGPLFDLFLVLLGLWNA